MSTNPISPVQKMLVRRSFRKIARQPDLVAELLYDHLFEISPACKMLFACDMRRQGRKLIQMLAVTVVGLNTPEVLVPAIRGLGERHIRYGAKAEDYKAVGEALLYALQKTLGEEDWTPELKAAWLAYYEFIAETATLPAV